MAAEVEIVVNATDNASGILGNFGNIISGIESAINLVGQAFDAAAGVITPFIESASESEQAIARLEGVLRATNNAIGIESSQLQFLADSLQGVTRFSDETILAGEAMLLTFRNIGAETFERTVPAMLDMAEIFGSVDSAALQLGKALNDPLTGITALQRVGVTFSAEQREMIANFVEMGDIASAQDVILSELEAQVGGLAQTMGQTFSGQVAIFNNSLDTVRETIGGALLPALTDLLNKFTEFINRPQVFEFFAELAMDIGEVAHNFGFLGQALVDLLAGDMDSLLDTFVRMGAEGIPGMREFSDMLVGLDELDPSTALNIILEFFNQMTGIDLTGIVEPIQRFIDTMQTEGLGAAISEAFASIDIESGLQTLVDRIAVVLDEIDWAPIAEVAAGIITGAIELALRGLDAVVNRIDWTPLGNALRGALREIGEGLADDAFDWGQIGQDIMDGIGNIFQYTPIGQLTIWVNNLVAKVKEILGIASPSTVFMQIGRDVVQGLINGFDFAWANLLDTARNALDDFFSLFGIDLSSVLGGGTTGGSTGSHNTGGTTTPTDSTTAGGNTYNFYAPSYWGFSSPDGLADCPSPHPLVAASGNQLVVSGF